MSQDDGSDPLIGSGYYTDAGCDAAAAGKRTVNGTASGASADAKWPEQMAALRLHKWDAFKPAFLRFACDLSTADRKQLEDVLRGLKVGLTEWKKELKAFSRADDNEDEDGGRGIDFVVSRMEKELSDPPIYHLTIEGRRLTMGAEVLLSPALFSRAFCQALDRVPEMPGRRKGEKRWKDHVNEWLDSAEMITVSPEASESFRLQQAIADHVDRSAPSEDLVDVKNGKNFLDSKTGRRAFSLGPLEVAIKRIYPKATKLPSVLREMGCANKPLQVEGVQIRVWLAPLTWPTDELQPGEVAEEIEPAREPGQDG